MKKILALLCCSVLALGCGCSGSEDKQSSSEQSFLDAETLTACTNLVNLCDDIIDGHIKAEYCTDEFEKYYTIIQSARSESEETKLDTIKIICDTMKIEIDRKNYDTKQGQPNYEFEYDLNESRNKLANYIGVAEREIN